MTSAILSHEPIAINNQTALGRLQGLADQLSCATATSYGVATIPLSVP
jgi:hypothetical protein